MKSYSEFCQQHELNSEAPDTQIQFEQYKEAYQLLVDAIGETALSDSQSV